MGSFFKKALALTAGVAGYELSTRWWEKIRSEQGYRYWRSYYRHPFLDKVDKLIRPVSIRSGGVNLHMDVLEQAKKKSPVLVLNHGVASYGKLMLPLAMEFYEKGYTVVVPDQKGRGFSGGVRGDYTVKELAVNLVDVAQWADQQFSGPVYMIGGSLGGALTYYAAAEGAPVKAIACLNLLDFSYGRDAIDVTRFDQLSEYFNVELLMEVKTKLSRPFHWMRLPFNIFVDFEKMLDEVDYPFYERWLNDPLLVRFISLRAISSMLHTPPAIPIELNDMPVLVLNQKYDTLMDPAITRNNFERLGGEKEYVEIPFNHWSRKAEFERTVADAAHKWFQKHK